jgi:hypothetical protein
MCIEGSKSGVLLGPGVARIAAGLKGKRPELPVIEGRGGVQAPQRSRCASTPVFDIPRHDHGRSFLTYLPHRQLDFVRQPAEMLVQPVKHFPFGVSVARSRIKAHSAASLRSFSSEAR